MKNVSPEKKALMSKTVPYILGILALALIVYVGLSLKNKSRSSMPAATDVAAFKKNLVSLLPAEAKDRVFVNQEDKRKDHSIVSTVYMSTSPDHGKEIPSLMKKYFEASYNMLKDEKLPITAVIYGVIISDPKEKDQSKAKQYRIILGSEVLLSLKESVWNQDSPELFAWLSSECPKTSPSNLSKYCDISESLKTK